MLSNRIKNELRELSYQVQIWSNKDQDTTTCLVLDTLRTRRNGLLAKRRITSLTVCTADTGIYELKK